MRWTLLVCTLSLVAACAPSDEGIAVERRPDGSFRLTLEGADIADEIQGQKLLLPAAVQLCGEREFAFGEDRFDPKTKVLVQDLRCTVPKMAAPSPLTFTPTAADETAISDLSAQFLKARDAADLTAAQGFFPPEWPMAEQKAWVAETAAFDKLAGAQTKRVISRISWFENPPVAPAPGVYAAVDYIRAFDKVRTACGFIVWRRQADGSWRIDREKLSYLTPEQEAATARADLPEVRANLGCR